MINNEKVSEFLGWYAGDGCLSVNSRYSEFALTGDIDEEYIFYENIICPTVNGLFGKYLKKPIRLKRYISSRVCGFYTFDKNFINFLKKNYGLKAGKKIDIKIPASVRTKEEKIPFIRGLFDTDGSIFFCRSNFIPKKQSFFNKFHYKPKIKVATISYNLINGVFEILSNLGYSPRVILPTKQRNYENTVYGLVLDTKFDTRKWISEIGFKNYKHSSKLEVWNKFGFCPPHSTLKQRIKMLDGELDPKTFYPAVEESLQKIRVSLRKSIFQSL